MTSDISRTPAVDHRDDLRDFGVRKVRMDGQGYLPCSDCARMRELGANFERHALERTLVGNELRVVNAALYGVALKVCHERFALVAGHENWEQMPHRARPVWGS